MYHKCVRPSIYGHQTRIASGCAGRFAGALNGGNGSRPTMTPSNSHGYSDAGCSHWKNWLSHPSSTRGHSRSGRGTDCWTVKNRRRGVSKTTRPTRRSAASANYLNGHSYGWPVRHAVYLRWRVQSYGYISIRSRSSRCSTDSGRRRRANARAAWCYATAPHSHSSALPVWPSVIGVRCVAR